MTQASAISMQSGRSASMPLLVAELAGPDPLHRERRLAPAVGPSPAAILDRHLDPRAGDLGRDLRAELERHPRLDRQEIERDRDRSDIGRLGHDRFTRALRGGPAATRNAIRSARSWGFRSFSSPSGISDWPEAAISSISERSRTSSLPSWRRRVTAVADSLAIRPFKTRPSTVATEKLAYFASNARLGSRMAIRATRATCRSSVARSGPTSTPFLAQPVARGTQLLEHRRAGGLVSLDAECRAIGVDDRLPRLGSDGRRRPRRAT